MDVRGKSNALGSLHTLAPIGNLIFKTFPLTQQHKSVHIFGRMNDMNKFQEKFEFSCTLTDTMEGDQQTTLSFTRDMGGQYDEVVEKFFGFLSSVYGYPITLDRMATEQGYKQEWPEFGTP